jgi:hypothetical protein
MAILDFTSVLGKLIPTASINRITLESTTPNPPKRENSHIETPTQEEIQKKFKFFSQRRRPPAPDARFIKKNIESDTLKVTLDMSINEVLDADFVGKWFDKEKIKKYTNIVVVQSTDPAVSAAISETGNTKLFDRDAKWAPGGLIERRLAVSYGTTNMSVIKERFYKAISIKRINLETDFFGNRKTIEDKRSENKQVTVNGTNLINPLPVVEIDFRTSFLSKNDKPEHLVYFAFSSLDVEKLKEDFGLKFLSPSVTPATANVEMTSEVVIDNSEIAGFSFVFYDISGNVWTGPYHTSQTDGAPFNDEESKQGLEQLKKPEVVTQQNDPSYFSGTVESVQQMPLRLERVPNSKIQDFRNVKEIEKLQIDLKVIQEELRPIENKFLVTKQDNMLPDKKISYFSKLCLANTRTNSATLFFTVDYKKLIKNSSVYGKMFDLAEEEEINEILNNSRIKYMTLVRRRTTATTEYNSFGNPMNGSQVFDKEEYAKTIARGWDTPENSFSASNDATGGIREIDVFLSSKQNGLRFFTAEDRSMINITDGIYEYGVELEVEDGSFKYLLSLGQGLSEALHRLKEYYNEGNKLGMTKYITEIDNPHVDSTWERAALVEKSPGNYEPLSNRYTQDFIREQRLKARRRATPAPWRVAVEQYMKTVLVTTNFSEMEKFDRVSENLLKISSPETGNPYGVVTLIRLIEGQIARMEKVLNINISSDANESSGTSTKNSYSGNRDINKSVKIQHWFTEAEFDSNNLKNYGIEYLSYREEDDFELLKQKELLIADNEPRSPGLVVVESEDYQKRVELETLKYFRTSEPQMNLRSANKQITRGDDVNRTSFTFLAPSACFLGDEAIRFIKEDSGAEEQDYPDDHYSLAEAKIVSYNRQPKRVKKFRRQQNKTSISDTAREYKDVTTSMFAEKFNIRIESVESEKPRETTFIARSPISPILSLVNELAISTVRQEKLDPLVAGVDFQLDQEDKLEDSVNPNSFTSQLLSGNQGIPTKVKKLSLAGRKINMNKISVFDIRERDNLASIIQDSEEVRKEIAKSTGTGSEDANEVIRSLPNQIKSLLLDGTENVTRRPLLSLDYDAINDAKTASFFRMRYKFLKKVEVLVGYTGDDNMRLSDPVWKPLTLRRWVASRGETLICRMVDYNLPFVFNKSKVNKDMPTFSEYFILNTPSNVFEQVANFNLAQPEIEVVPNKRFSLKSVDEKISEFPTLGVLKGNIVGSSLPQKFCPPFRKKIILGTIAGLGGKDDDEECEE